MFLTWYTSFILHYGLFVYSFIRPTSPFHPLPLPSPPPTTYVSEWAEQFVSARSLQRLDHDVTKPKRVNDCTENMLKSRYSTEPLFQWFTRAFTSSINSNSDCHYLFSRLSKSWRKKKRKKKSERTGTLANIGEIEQARQRAQNKKKKNPEYLYKQR